VLASLYVLCVYQHFTILLLTYMFSCTVRVVEHAIELTMMLDFAEGP